MSVEMLAYAPLIGIGDYFIVEDTNLNGHTAFPQFGKGPMKAVDALLAKGVDFVTDPSCERFLSTLNPSRYLKLAAGSSGGV